MIDAENKLCAFCTVACACERETKCNASDTIDSYVNVSGLMCAEE